MDYSGRLYIDKSIKHIVSEGRVPRIFFIGIGGVSMSSLALASIEKGYAVGGSDRSESELTKRLSGAGAAVAIGQTGDNIRAFKPDIAVRTAAVHDDNPEVIAVRELGVELYSRAEYLGYIMADFETRLGVCGMHGKSTTTGLVSHLLIDGGFDPTVEVGAAISELGGNCRDGKSGLFVYEACEYTDSFLYTEPTDVIVTNIDLEHLDWFKDLDAIIESFRKYISYSRRAVVNAVDDNVMKACAGFTGELITYSADPAVPADYSAKNITYDHGHPEFDVYERGEYLLHARLGLIGAHNVMNTLAAIAEARALGMDAEAIAASLPTFTGCQRRFERICELATGAVVYDDYAHHPTEAATTLRSAKSLGYDRIVAIFQPHTFSRLQGLYGDFVDLFRAGGILSEDDIVIFADIYAARENAADWNVSSKGLADDTGRMYLGGISDIAEWVDKNTHEGDIVLTIGAGDIVKLTKMIKLK